MGYYDAFDRSAPGGIVINPHSELGKELRRWELPKAQGGMNCDGYEEYPRMLYQAQAPNGKAEVHRIAPPRYAFAVGQVGDAEWTQASVMAEEFTRRCQTIVHNDMEKANMLSRGWYLTQDAALAGYEAAQRAIGDASAERLHFDQRMSAKAKAEAAAADVSTHEHVTDVVPKRKRGRPTKGVVAKSS